MKTILIEINEPTGAGGYPVALRFDDGTGFKKLATGKVSTSLGNPPIDASGQPLDAGRIVDLLLRQSESASFADIGRYLFALVSNSGIGETWTELRATHRATQEGIEGLHTVFEVRPASLSGLPWELMMEKDVPIFLDRFNPSMRGTIDAEASDDLPPLRLLLVVGDRAQMEDETVEILAAVDQFQGFMECQVLEEPSHDDLVTTVTTWRPHIFHFTGHAEQPPGSPGYLRIGSGAASWKLEAPDIAINFQGHAGRLAVLNACRTDQGGVHVSIDEARQASASVAAAFQDAGFLAVIGMQADIENGAAGRFGKVLYTSLSKRTQLDLAVSQARFAIYSERGRKKRDWALPALTVSAPPAKILAIRDCLVGRPNSLSPEGTKEFRDIRTFVNQHEKRRTAWLGVDPAGFLDLRPKGLVVVRGGSQAGKTWLMYHCLRACAVRGRLVRLVELSSIEPLDFLAVLRAIKDGTNPAIGGSPLREGLPQPAFSEFHHALSQLATGSAEYRPYEPAMGTIPDPGLRFDRSSGDVEGRVKRLFDAFRNGLSAVASEQPLIIALDGLDGVEPTDFQNFVRPLLIKSIAEANEPPVRLIVALTDDLHNTLWSSELDTSSTVIALEHLATDRFPSLFTEYLLAMGTPWAMVKKARDKLAPLMVEPWSPGALKEFTEFAKRWKTIE